MYGLSLLRRFSSKSIPIHLSNAPVDTTKLHDVNQRLHGKLGPIYKEKLGPDVEAVWIADPRMTETLLRNEPEHPMHVVPQCWQVFNEKRNMDRGLFFLDGKKWQTMRKKMNPLLLKTSGAEYAHERSKAITDNLIKNLILQADSSKLCSEIRIDMEPILHKWSVESTLASLFGDSYDFDDDLDNFIKHVHDMFDFSAILQTKSAEMECKENTADWQGFSQAAHGALSFFQQKLATCKVTDGLISQLQSSFSEQEVIHIANDLMIAAAVTTSYTTLWTIYLLGINPEEQNSKIPAKLKCREAMRLFPVAPFLTRIQQKSLDIDGFEILQGQLVLLSIYAMGRNCANFENPEMFDPSRWIRNPSTKKPQGVSSVFASLPFGFGSRSCIGKKLAENDMDYFIKLFCENFEVEVLNDEPVKMKMKMVGMPDTKIDFRLKRK